jgi:hypothetical protein
MSEQETELEDVPAGVDPMTGEVIEPEPEPTEPEPEPEPEPGPEPEGARDDREIEAIYKRLDTRAANYIKSAAEIVADESVPLQVCEMCKDGYPGLRWAEPQDELHANLLHVVSENEQGAPLKVDPNAEVCHVCDGFGMVKIPSHVPNNQVRSCRACNGAGYRELNPQSGSPEPPRVSAPNGEVEPMPGVPLDDPVLADYMARGYTVIPPMTFSGGES